MQDNIKYLDDNHNCTLLKRPKGKKALENIWIYRMKLKVALNI